MEAALVVEGFNVIKDRQLGVPVTLGRSPINLFTFRVLQKLSMNAWSQQLPLRLMNTMRSPLTSAARWSAEAYLSPRLDWNNRSLSVSRRQSAMEKHLKIGVAAVSMEAPTAQPTTFRPQ